MTFRSFKRLTPEALKPSHEETAGEIFGIKFEATQRDSSSNEPTKILICQKLKNVK